MEDFFAMIAKPNPPKNAPKSPEVTPKLVLTQAQKYQKAYELLFDKLTPWKQDVIKNCKNKSDRVWMEFGKEVVLLAEDEKFC